ncbi:hypothetical protein, partial [Microbacterium gubbeenense]
MAVTDVSESGWRSSISARTASVISAASPMSVLPIRLWSAAPSAVRIASTKSLPTSIARSAGAASSMTSAGTAWGSSFGVVALNEVNTPYPTPAITSTATATMIVVRMPVPERWALRGRFRFASSVC